MGCCHSCSSTTPQSIDLATHSSENQIGLLLLGSGEQGKNTLRKQIALKYGNNKQFTDCVFTVQDNIFSAASPIAQSPVVKAYFSQLELRNVANKLGITIAEHDLLEAQKGIALSVEVYTNAFRTSLEKDGAIWDVPYTWPALLSIQDKAPPPDLHHDTEALDPTTDEYLQLLMSRAAEAQLVLAQKLLENSSVDTVASAWKPHNKALNQSGLLELEVDWVDQAFNPGIKTVDRIREKAQYKYKGDFSKVKDISRFALQFHTYAKMTLGLSHIDHVFGSEVMQLDNRFRVVTGLGWRDLSMLVRVCLPSCGAWHVCEIQLHHSDMSTARTEAHKFYGKVRRVLEQHIPPHMQGAVFDPEMPSLITAMQTDAITNLTPAQCDTLAAFYSHKVVLEHGVHMALTTTAVTTNFVYLSERVKEVLSKDYVPSRDDFLWARSRITGIIQSDVQFRSSAVHVMVVGGQHSERRKWHNVYDKTSVVAVCVALADYGTVLWEDGTMTRTQDNIQLFGQIVNDPKLMHARVVLVLTMIDLLPLKLKHLPFRSVPEFEGYTGDDQDVDSVVAYFQALLLAQCNDPARHVTTIVTSVIDSGNLETIMSTVCSA